MALNDGYNLNDGNSNYVNTGGSFSGGGDNTMLSPNGGGGGGGNPTPPKFGCTDPRATNYDSTATYNDGTCMYGPTQVYNTQNLTIQLGIQSNPKDGVVLVDGVEQTTKATPTRLSFSQKELLTPKQITVKNSAHTSNDIYRVSTIQKEHRKQEEVKVPFDDTIQYSYEQDPLNSLAVIRKRVEIPSIITNVLYFPYYELIIEKLIDGTFVQQQLLESNYSETDAILNANLTFDLVQATPTPEIPTPTANITVNADVYASGLITYKTSDGKTAAIKNGENKFEVIPNGSSNYVQFNSNGLSTGTHLVTYEVVSKGTTKKYNTLDLKLETSVDNIVINLTVSKAINDTTPPLNAPTLNTEGISFQFNIAGKDELKIPYNSTNSDEVVFSLGTTQRVLSPNGSIVLSKNDFYNGVGNYILYLQPRSTRAGSGETIKVNINVVNKYYLPGPDITHIYYPQNIKGADFKEYNVEFDVSWQSINTNYVQIYVSKYDKEYALGKFPASGLVTLNVGDVLRKSKLQYNEDTDKTQFELLLVPFNAEGDELTEGKVEKISLLFDKGDLKLQRGKVVSDIIKAFELNFNETALKQEISKFLTHYLHLGKGDNKLIATWGIDTETFSEYRTDSTTGTRFKTKEEKSLVLKLYEPLPREIQPNQQLWVSKIESIPIIEQITIIDELKSECTPLRPNFNVSLNDEIGYQILDDLIASGSTTSTDLVNSYVSSSGFSLDNLHIKYEITGSDSNDYYWENFVKYSSAEERVKNFYYKIQLLEFYNDKKTFISSSIQYASGSISATNELKKYDSQIQSVKNGLDGFEKFLYSTTGSFGLTYPGAGKNQLSASDSVDAVDWYDGVIASAQTYDDGNKSLLTLNIPSHITNTPENGEFVLFLNMIGQHFDVLWAHIKGISQVKKLEHKFENGIGNDIIYHMLESLGWNAEMGVSSQYLWEYAFGKHSDGTTVSSMSGKDRQGEIWRRILNNLPYLLKHKGTKRALHAAMACYGVPSSLLTIMEFGGPSDPTTSATTSVTFDDRTCALNFNTTSYLKVPFSRYSSTLGTNEYPNAIEFRINTTNNSVSQSLLRTSAWELKLIPNSGSLAKLQLSMGGEIVSTSAMPFYNDEYTNIVINRTISGTNEIVDLYFKEGFQDRIRNEISISHTFASGSTGWGSGSLYIGEGLTGSLDEFRLWRTPLLEANIDNHTLLPDAIDGSHISASSHDLLFRLDFEYPKNLTTIGSIKNVAILQNYTGSAQSFNFNETTYPYNYIPYERSVTAKVPSSGLTLGNKFRFESQTMTGDLNYKSRATKKSFDQAPIDTDKLGLFFSPMKEINMDILRSLGEFNIDDYIGNPEDQYNDSYSDLSTLRNYYFQRYDLNIQEYIQLVRYIDKSLFETLESLVPARAKVSSGLLIEPHILERSKVAWKRPSATNDNYTSSINTTETSKISSIYDVLSSNLSTSESVRLDIANPQYNADIQTELFTSTSADYTTYYSIINNNIEDVLTAKMDNISVAIDAQITGSIKGQYDQTEYVQIGLDRNSLLVAGFGLYGNNGNSIRNFIDVYGNRIKERSKVYLIKESYTENVPTNISLLDKSMGTELISVTKYRYNVNILPFTSSITHAENAAPTIGGNIIEVTPLNGYFPTHYRNTGDLSTGLQNSYFNGSKQTTATNILGGSPVQTFTTNPNILKVSNTGRGSGEPILEVD